MPSRDYGTGMHTSAARDALAPRQSAPAPWHLSWLLVAMVCTALLLVWSTHDSRQLNRLLHGARQQLAAERLVWRQLSLEYSTLVHHARIEELSRQELNMRPPHLGDSKFIDLRTVSTSP